MTIDCGPCDGLSRARGAFGEAVANFCNRSWRQLHEWKRTDLPPPHVEQTRLLYRILSMFRSWKSDSQILIDDVSDSSLSCFAIRNVFANVDLRFDASRPCFAIRFFRKGASQRRTV